MSKNKKTKVYEMMLCSYLHRKVIYCNEVALHKHNNFYNNKYVDFLAYDREKNFICYEVKVSKKDFKSQHGKNFVGNYNYYVMPRELYEVVKNEIPHNVGCYVEHKTNCGKISLYKVKKACYQELKEYDDTSLQVCLMGALYREATRNKKSKLLNALYDYKHRGLFRNE